nr:lysoplasmalogenase [Candidatus Sigynarchaeota archaeon]
MIVAIIFLVGLAIATAFNIAGNLKQIRPMVVASKPLLVPCIIGFYIDMAAVVNPLIIIALAFGCGGDVFLLWKKTSEKAVLFGLLSFMIGHVFYIIAFAGTTGFAGWQWWFALLVIPYVLVAFLIFTLLKKDFGKMKAPATVYMGVLLAMSVFALSRGFAVTGPGFWLVWLGSLSFIVSDALLAVEQFKLKHEILNHVIVMATYIAAQLLIAAGFAA